jgi:hypothetical protein
MENREGTLMGIGAVAIACLCYFYQQYKEERLEYKAKKKTLEDRCKAIIQNGNRIDFESIKASGQKELVFFPSVTNYQLNAGTFKKIMRNRENKYIVRPPRESVRENESGGHFYFKDQTSGQRVRVEINDCGIEEEAL